MKKLCALALFSMSGVACAQTPTLNLMPDGSHDMYIGLGAAARPTYEGARHHRTRPLPVLQVQWSNGLFISGQSAGWHLLSQPSMEAGPLLALLPGRTESGTGSVLGGVINGADAAPASITSVITTPVVPSSADALVPAGKSATLPAGVSRLTGMDELGARVVAGGFFNVYLRPELRLSTSVLAGAGQQRDGAYLNVDLQRIATELAPRHWLSVAAGLTLANQHYNQAYFGVSAAESARGYNRIYRAGAGLKDVHATARWNWMLSPSWMLSSGLSVTRLAGSAADSPLVERRTNISVSTALAYRF